MQRGTFCAVGYDEVIQGDASTFQYIREVEKISKLAHGVKQNKILAAIPHTKELQHERAIVPPQTLNSVFSTKCKHCVKPLHRDPKLVEPRCLSCEVTVIVIAPVQGDTVKAYLDKGAVVRHCQSIAVCLAKDTPITKEK